MYILNDFETRSCCDLKKTGAYIYARDPSTEVLCLAYTTDGQDIKLWRPGLSEPEDLFAWIKQGVEMHAWNSMFERLIMRFVCAARMGWPDVPDDQWRCTQAKAASYGLPKKLEKAAAALGTKHQKNMSGHRTMLRYSKPRKPTKNNPSIWWDDPEKLEQIYEYCRDDVRTEYEISSVLKDLSPSELAVWKRSEQINLRGVAVDPELATKAIALGVPAKQSANEEIARLTGNAVQDTGARDALKTWLKVQGVTVPLKFDKKTKTDKETTGAKMLEKLLKSGAIKDPLAQRVVQVWIKANKSSVAKYASILEHAGKEGRVREAFVYHGALTGRFCLTGEHEILTPNGWERLDAWKGGPIACWNQNETISFQPSTPVSFPYEGDMVRFASNRINQLATPDHKMPTWHTVTGQFKIKEVKDFNGRTCISYTGVRAVPRTTDEAALRVLIMVQADGHYKSDGQVVLRFKKARKIQRCQQLLRRAGIVFSRKHWESDDSTQFDIARRHMPLYLQMFNEKTFGWWMLDSDPSVIFEELEYWDAYRCGPNSVQYSSTNRQNAEIVQTCAHLSGRAATIIEKDANVNWATCYVVNIWLTPSNRHELRGKHERLPFKGQVYCAQTPTGFFMVRRNGTVWVTGNSGRGIQPQNFPRPPEGLENTDQVCQDILDCEYEELSMLYGPDQIMGVLSAGLRGALVAGPGLILQSADFSSIEARGAAWFAGDKALLTIFRQLDAEPDADWDLYTWQASRLLNEKVTKKDKIKRQNWGKVPSLACFYQASGKAVVRFADEQLGVTLDPKVADEVVAGWRADRKPIVKCWRACEDAAVEAVRRQHLKERVVIQGPVKWGVVGRFLKCRLPSGRTISYLDPKIESVTVQYTRNGEKKQFTKDTVTFMGQDQFTRKWKRLALYGGRYFENIVSGMCRDLLTAAMERVEEAGYPVVLHAHDELACEVQPNFGSNKEFVRLMSIKPDWAGNFPIAVSGEWRGRRYRK